MSTPIKLFLLLVGAIVVALASRSLYISVAGPAEPKVEETVQIRIAADALPAGLLLRNDDLEWRSVARSAVPAGAVVEGDSSSQDIAGVMVRRDIPAGTPILERDVIRPSSPGFLSAVLKPGMRAVSVGVDAVTGNAGLIQPGDYVDIILVQESSQRGGAEGAIQKARSVVSETIVDKARVIAVGSTFLQSSAPEGSSQESGNRGTANRTVTVEVMPRAAEAVAVASRLGSLTLALRSFAITDRNAGRMEGAGSVSTLQGTENTDGPLWASDVSRAIANAAALEGAARRGTPPATDVTASVPAASGIVRDITIFRGSEQTTQTVGNPATGR